MFVIKYGGSRLSKEEGYDLSFIGTLAKMVRDYSSEKFMIIIGGGFKARQLQEEGLRRMQEGATIEDLFSPDENLIEQGNGLDPNSPKYVSDLKDLLGIKATRDNAAFVIQRFGMLGIRDVCPQVVFDSSDKVEGDYRIFFAGGYKPGASTDHPTLMLAHAYGATDVVKISDFPIVKDLCADEVEGLTKDARNAKVAAAPDLPRATWKKMLELAGEWKPGKHVALDPESARFGIKHSGMTLYICPEDQLKYALARDEKHYAATIVRG